MKTAVFNPVLAQVVTGRVETGLCPIEYHLPMIANPDLADRININERATKDLNAFRKPLNGRIIDRFKHKEIARAN